jgi:hypothetical protein
MMTGRITMLGISRWAGKGGSYRTVQRLFSTVLPWAMLFWVFFRQHGIGSCTCTMRINLTGSPLDCHKSKKA